MFEKATRQKLRFNHKGLISTEDLWDLSQKELDSIYKSLSKIKKESCEESLLDKSSEDSILNLKLEIVKYIFTVKSEEKDRAKKSRERAEKKHKLLEVLASKQDEQLKEKSIEEIKKAIEELEK
jgi:hypothetical protein